MSMSLRATGWKVGLIVLGCGGVATGVAVASSAATPPPVDHQLCYTASGTFKVPSGVKLKDQFSPRGFAVKINPQLALHCNPVIKAVPGRVFKVTNPAAHLACLPIRPVKKQPTPKVVVTNQFGRSVLAEAQPNLLCLPSWKGLNGPPNKRPNTPPRLNHFTCYPVITVSGQYKPPPVMLRDEFTQKPVAAQVQPLPAELCLPTAKIVGTRVSKIINPAQHLLCFFVTPTPIIPTVWDENQFGTSKVAIRQTKWLCVPSTKKLG